MSFAEGVLGPATTLGELVSRLRRAATVTQGWWLSLSATEQARIKVAGLGALVVAAFHYSLSSLLQTVDYDTPLAYVGLVPILAMLLAWLHRVPAPNEPSIHDRQLDYVVGLPMVVLALLGAYYLPDQMGLMYWFDRIDLLLLPVFVAGAAVLLFGTRAAWRQRFAIGYLFLAWPWPYSHVLLGTLNGFTNLTVSSLTRLIKVVRVAHSVSGSPGLFEVTHHGQTFPVSVVTACSGIDGMVGFLLIGVGFAGTVSGSRLRKTIWLVLGAALLWMTNLGRLLLIFWAGEHYGENFAINILHPVAGLIIFCIGVILMALLIKPFGLKFFDSRSATAMSFRPVGAKAGTQKVFLAAGLVAVVAFALCVNNAKLSSYELVSTAAGEPKLAPFLASPATPSGWTADYETEYFINKPLFGQSSRWFRYLFFDSNTHVGDLQSALPVTADVIDAASLGGFNEYGVEACYNFHDYLLRDVAQVNLGNGIAGQAMSFSGSQGVGNWSVVYWIWPVETSTGTRYERIILYLQNTVGLDVRVDGKAPAVKGINNALNAASPTDEQLIENRAFLVAFAREVVAGQIKKTDTNVNIADVAGGQSGSGAISKLPMNPASVYAREHPASTDHTTK